MSDQVLTIDANDLQHFFLRVENGTLLVSRDPFTNDGALRNLLIKGIHCELLVTDASVSVTATDQDGRPFDQLLVENQEGRLDCARIRVASSPADSSKEGMPPLARDDQRPVDHRLIALNGTEFGRVFHLSETRTTRIGTDPRAANLVLKDSFAAHVQCKVEITGGRVFISHLDGSGGTFVNKQRILGRTELRTGDVLRIGNTQLRYESETPNETAGSPQDSTFSPIEGRASVTPPTTLPPLRQTQPGPMASTVTAESVKPEVASPVPSALDRLVGLENQTFGRFQVEKLLGRGHVGVVFRARDLKVSQIVALKVLSPDFPKSDEEIQNFSRVLKPAASLRDSHLLALKSIGRTDNLTWIAREYIEGGCLWSRLESFGQRPSWREACRIGVQIGAALDFLHQHDIAHLNVTPRNILIRRDDQVAKLADALLAQALEGSYLHHETLDKKRIAEAVYLAPEQLTDTDKADFRSDLYALGVLCYQLAVGRPPYSGRSIEELLSQISRGGVQKPSRQSPDIPPSFEAAILKLLSRRPENRLANVGEFLDIVEPILMMHGLR